jgi:hypothetical protein
MEKSKFVFSRQIFLAVVATIGGLWVLGALLGLFSGSHPDAVSPGTPQAAVQADGHVPAATQTPADSHAPAAHKTPADSHAPAARALPADSHAPMTPSTASAEHDGGKKSAAADHAAASAGDDAHGKKIATTGHAAAPAADDAHGETAATAHGATADTGHTSPAAVSEVQLAGGVRFIDACIEPMEYELRERFWGWRPNDILDFTDNVNNYQLGVLEVTRRTAVILAERISRTGSTAAFDPNLKTP